MKLLITGGTTFVSRYTAEYFVKRGDDVTVLNRNSRPQPDGVTLINADRTQLGTTLEQAYFDAVLDVTAYTKEHIEGLVKSGVCFGEYVFISSSAVYPETNEQPFTENQMCGENSVWGAYGTNKLEAESFLQENVPDAYILRPPYFYGKYDNLYREAFPFDCAMSGRPFYIPGDGSMKLQFFNVCDLCRFIEILLTQHPESGIYNVGNPEAVTIADWVQLCYSAADKKAELISEDISIPQRSYFCFHNYEYFLDVSKQTALMHDVKPLDEGLREEFLWYKDNPDSIYRRNPYLDFINNYHGIL